MLVILLIITGIILIAAAGAILMQNRKDVYERALALAAMGNFVDARIMIRNILDGSPSNSRAHFVMAKIFKMEGDLPNELKHLEQLKKIGNFDKDFPEASISNRIGDIYYQQEMFEESIFHYADTLEVDAENPEANIRIGFMALGQREFRIADRFLSRVAENTVNFPAFFLAKGVIAGVLERSETENYLEKAYNMDPASPVAAFLYAVSLAHSRKLDQAIKIANEVVDLVSEDYIRYTLFEFIMLVYGLQKNYSEALKHARLCVELAKANGWQHELIDSDLHFSMFAIRLNRLEEASEFLIEAESERMDDPTIIALADYKFDVEQKKVELGKPGNDGFDLDGEISRLFSIAFPPERYFEISGMRAGVNINVRGILDDEGNKVARDLKSVGVSKLEHYRTMSGTEFKNLCVKMILALNHSVSREIPNKEGDGVNYIGLSKENRNNHALFQFRKWKDAKVSDLFLRDTLSQMSELSLSKAFIIGDAQLTEGARKVLADNANRVVIISGRDMEDLMDKADRVRV